MLFLLLGGRFFSPLKILMVRLKKQVAVCEFCIFLPKMAVAAQRRSGKAHAGPVMSPKMAVRSGCVCVKDIFHADGAH